MTLGDLVLFSKLFPGLFSLVNTSSVRRRICFITRNRSLLTGLSLLVFLNCNLMSLFHLDNLVAELQRAKRASEAPWVRKIGNPSS